MSASEQASVQPRKPRIYVTRRIPDEGLRLLADVCDVTVWEGDDPPQRATLERELRDADGAITLLTDRIDGDVMDAAPRLRVISNFAVGYDNVDIAAATARGIVVGNTPNTLTESTADFAFALLMAAARRVPEGARFARAGRWTTWGPMLLLGVDVHHATLGLIGLGRIGSEVARRARGFDMQVLYTNRTRHEAMERELGLEYASLDDLLAQSDFVSLHTPLTSETARLLDAQRLAQMKRGAILINTARGAIVDTDALVLALRDGPLGGAALDVTDPEPLPAEHPLYSLPNALITPHMASASHVTRSAMAVQAAHNLLAGLRGKPLPNGVNPEAQSHGRSAAPRPWDGSGARPDA
ncbi:MAG TPA: D-glycerate dehydrogenase [Ktedonobacterales bacterium]|jgi:glyoxylate reductase|nr:D-glycerate dehydrogenase [Ktedonobacterales bacterium]